MDWTEKLGAYSESHPLLLLCLDKSTSDSLNESRRGPARFSFAKRHHVFDSVKPPCLCLIYLHGGPSESAYLGIAKSKRAVTLLDSAIQIISGHKILPETSGELADSLSKTAFQKRFREDLRTEISVLPRKLSRDLVSQLTAIDANNAHLRHLSFHLFGKDTLELQGQMQEDAIRLALAAFGLDKLAIAASISTARKTDGTLQFHETDNRILEAIRFT